MLCNEEWPQLATTREKPNCNNEDPEKPKINNFKNQIEKKIQLYTPCIIHFKRNQEESNTFNIETMMNKGLE